MEASGLTPADSALEVGPGLGSLTRHLAAVAASVTAVEKDDALYSRLVNTLTEVRLLWEPREGDRPLGASTSVGDAAVQGEPGTPTPVGPRTYGSSTKGCTLVGYIERHSVPWTNLGRAM